MTSDLRRRIEGMAVLVGFTACIPAANWLVGNVVGFGQQMLINRLLKSKDDEEPQPPAKDKASSSKKKLTEASAT